MAVTFKVSLPVNTAYPHRYFAGSGAAAISRSDSHYYVMAMHDGISFKGELLQLAAAVLLDHPKRSWSYRFSVVRIYDKINLDTAVPVLTGAVERLNGPKRITVNLDCLLTEPPLEKRLIMPSI